MDAAGLDAGLLLQFGDDRSQRMAVKRVAMQRFAVQHELPALGFCRWGGDRYLAAELIGRPSAFGCTVVSTTTRSRSRVAKAPVLCATDKLSWSKATNCSSPSRWRQCVSEERSNGSW